MGRRRKDAPDLYLHRASGQWCVTLDGRRCYLGRDREKAEAERKRLVGERLMATGSAVPTSSIRTVDEALVAYLRHAKEYYDDPRQLARVREACRAVSNQFGAVPIADFDQLSLQAVRDNLLRRRSRRGKNGRLPLLSRRYVNHLIGCIKTAWVWLESRKLAPPGSSAGLRTVKSLRIGRGGRETPPITAVQAREVDAVLPHLGPVVRAMVEVQRLTGLRPGEVVTMRRCDLSLSLEERLLVPQSDPPLYVAAFLEKERPIWVYVPSSHKTAWRGKLKVAVVGPRAQDILAPFIQARENGAPTDYLFSPKGSKEFAGRRAPGARYSTASYGRAVKKGCKRAGVAPFSPNRLRKLAATVSDEESDRDTTAALLGHSTPQMAAVYAMQAIRRAGAHVAKHG